MFFFAFTTIAFAARPSAVELEAAWNQHAHAVLTTADHPVSLQTEDFKTIAAGNVAKRRIVEDGPDRALGVLWAPVDRKTLWVAVLDDIHDTVVKSLVERRLPRSDDGRKRLYQRLDLPWPFVDRQWVIEIWNNPDIVKASNGALWERAWDLAPSNLMPDPDPEALWVPMTNGSWFLMETNGGTLMSYSARTTIGGAIPDDLVTRWAMATLDEMMEHIVERCSEISTHYTDRHEPIVGGDGQVIQPMASPQQQ